MKGIIYKATNTYNGKVYIGQTIAGLPKRKQQHYRDAKANSGNAFHLALYQYPNGFTWEILDEFNGEREYIIHALNVAEEYHILKHNSMDERYGYNATAGGYSSDKFAEYIQRRQKSIGGAARPMLQYDLAGNFIREFSSLNEVSAFLNRDKTSPKDLIIGVHYGSQWRIKENEYFPKNIGEYKPVSVAPRFAPILAYDADGKFFGRYLSKHDAETATGVDCEKIMEQRKRNALGRIVVVERYAKPFYFFRDTDNYPQKIDVEIIKKKKREKQEVVIQNKAVACYSLDGKYIKTYDSMRSAVKETKTGATSIRRWCNSQTPLLLPPNYNGRYLWRYAIEPHAEKIDVEDHRAERVETSIWKTQPDGSRRRVFVMMTKTQAEKHKPKMEHRIIQYTLDGEFVKVWDNAHQAAESRTDTAATIRKILFGKETKKKPNYQWRFFSNDYPQSITPYSKITYANSTRQNDTIEELSWDGNIIATYQDTADAAEKSGCSISYVCNVLAGRIKKPKRRFRRVV